MKKYVEIDIYRSAEIKDAYGVTISRLENGSGDGYRIAGPKCTGRDEIVKTSRMTIDDIDRLIEELIDCKDFLREGAVK